MSSEDARLLARSSPAGFAHVCSAGSWVPFEHLILVNDYLLRVAAGEIDRLIITLPPRHGKLIAHDERVPTPNGWREHGDLEPGDEVFGIDGAPVRIVAVSDEGLASLRVTFTDGAHIDVHPEHEWKVYDRSCHHELVMTTEAMRDRVDRQPGRSTLQIDYAAAVKPPVRPLPMDPYTLGVWLGDGSTTKPAVTHHPDDWFELPYPVSTQCVHSTTGIYTTYFADLWGDLKATGVAGCKYIPERYLWADEESRRALLEGLIDTDGCVSPDGRVRFVNTNKGMIDDVAQLVRSLGYRASVTHQAACLSSNGIQGRRTTYTVAFSPHDGRVPARLERKRSRCEGSAVRRRRGVVSIEPIEPRPGRCIQIDSPDGLYLVGEHFTPTHNSELVSRWFPAWYLGTFPDRQVMLTAYEATFARSWGRKARDMLVEHGRWAFGVEVAETPRAADWWMIDRHDGVMVTAGVGGALTGKGANCLPGETLVQTDAGEMRIDVLARMVDRPRALVEREAARWSSGG